MLTNLASGADLTRAGIGFTGAIAAALSGLAGDADAGGDAAASPTVSVSGAAFVLAEILDALAFLADLPLRTSEGVAGVWDTDSGFTGLASLTALVLAKVHTGALLAGQPIWTAYCLAWFIHTTTFDTDPSSRALDVLAWVVQTAPVVADLTWVTGDTGAGIRFADPFFTAFFGCTAHPGAGLHTASGLTVLAICATKRRTRIRHTHTLQTQAALWATKRITIRRAALALPAHETLGTG